MVEDPSKIKVSEISSAVRARIRPEGTGLLLVLAIKLSICLSWYWLRPQEPPASKKIPRIGMKMSVDISLLARMNPADEERVTRKEILNLVSSRRILNMPINIFLPICDSILTPKQLY